MCLERGVEMGKISARMRFFCGNRRKRPEHGEKIAAQVLREQEVQQLKCFFFFSPVWKLKTRWRTFRPDGFFCIRRSLSFTRQNEILQAEIGK